MATSFVRLGVRLLVLAAAAAAAAATTTKTKSTPAAPAIVQSHPQWKYVGCMRADVLSTDLFVARRAAWRSSSLRKLNSQARSPRSSCAAMCTGSAYFVLRQAIGLSSVFLSPARRLRWDTFVLCQVSQVNFFIFFSFLYFCTFICT